MITSKPSLRSGFDCIIRPAPSGAGRTTPSQPGHYPLIRAWISNHMPGKVWGEITYPFLNFNGCTVEV